MQLLKQSRLTKRAEGPEKQAYNNHWILVVSNFLKSYQLAETSCDKSRERTLQQNFENVIYG